MTTIDVVNWDKKAVRTAELPAEIFEVPLRKELLNEVVRWQLACRRQGTHMTKTKGLVSGGGKKPYKQKGTGNARRGSSRSPLIRGGGTMFGPQPRDYSYTLPKKVRQLGLKMALSHLLRSGQLHVVDGMDSSQGKTGELSKRLKAFGVKKAILVDSEEKGSFKRAARNLSDFRYYPALGLNVYDILKYDTAIVTEGALDVIIKRFGVGV